MTHEDPDNQAECIRKRMAELRRELACDVRDVSRSAKAMANPAFYIRKFPWATLAAATAVGFMLVPRKRPQVVYPDAEQLAELVRNKQVHVEASAAQKQTKGMLQSLVVMGLTWAARTGMNYMVQRMTAAATQKRSEQHDGSAECEETHQPTER